MIIEFGWGLDGASWSAGRSAAAGYAIMGPHALVALLQTRLGLTHPGVEQPLRIAQYRELLRAADHEWPRASLATDAWSTARHLLRLRDAAIAAGWDGTAAPGAPARIGALAAAEGRIRRGPATAPDVTPGATLAPGPADDLREVHDMLAGLAASGVRWPLGIDELRLREDAARLPGLWPGLIGHLVALGVTVTTAPDRTGSPALRIVTADEEWSAAQAAARWLAAHTPDADRNTAGDELPAVLAGADTIVLDQELRRRGLPALGVAAASTERAKNQLLPLFLSLVVGPVDIRRLAAFCDLRFAVTLLPDPAAAEEPERAEDPADTERFDAEPIDPEPVDAGPAAGSAADEPTRSRVATVGIVPSSVRKAFLRALEQQPGLGGSAWTEALTGLEEAARSAHPRTPEGKQAASAWEVASTLDRFLRREPLPGDGPIPTAELTERVAWLEARLRRLAGRLGADDLHDVISHLRTFRTILDLSPTVAPAQLHRIAETCSGTGASPFRRPEVAPWRTATRPGHLAGARTVLWWGAEDPEAPAPPRWSRAEERVLAAAGARITPPEDLAALELDADLAGFADADEVVAIHRARIAEEPTRLHSLLPHLALVTGIDRPVRDVLAGVTVRADDLVDGDTWRLDAAERAVRIPPLAEIEVPADLTRHVAPGTQLLGERLSFSQVQTLIGCSLAWVLQKPFGLREGRTAQVPTGNRMIGTYVHAVVETLHREHAAESGAPDAATIREVAERLAPAYASQLLLPGRQAQLGGLYADIIDTVTVLFDTLAGAGIRMTGSEVGFERLLPLHVAGREREVTFTGSRDVDAEDEHGDPVVIDLKWSGSARRHTRTFRDGESLQLASYRWSLGEHADRTALAYYLLKQRRFVTDDDRHFPVTTTAARGPGEIWERLVRSVEHAWGEIARGTVTAASGQMFRDTGAALETATDNPYRDAAAARAAAEDAAGRLQVLKPCRFCEFSRLCGLTRDAS